MIKSARLKTVALFIMCLAESALPGEEAHSIKSILVINSYYSGFAWTDSIMKGIRSRIAAGATQIEISSEYLDARRVTDPAKMKIVRSIVLSKISALDPDLIIASDDSALDFIIENRSRLPREIPLVFCGVNKYSDSGSAARGKITGVIEKPSIAETVMAAITLRPDTKRIIVISRTTNPQDRYNREAFAAEIPSLPGHIEFLFWDDMNSEELAERLKGLDDSSAVFINGMISDPGGRDMMYRGSTEWISGHSPVPVYSLWEGYLGHGIVGGKIVSGRMHGRMAAELALRILEKGYEAPLPVTGGGEANVWMFDYRQLARFGISPSILPDGHILVNDPYSFYHRYKRNIWIFIGILMILLILLLFLVITVIMRRRTEMSLRQANLVVESSPAVLFRWRAAPGWPVDLVSKNVIQFGYSVEELVSGRVPFSSMVHPEDLDRVAAEVEHYSATGNDTYNQEYRIVTKSGDVRWVDDRSTIQRHADGSIHHYQGILMDITDRRIAEDNLKRTNGELDRIFNISQDMLCVMDTGGRFIRLNPAWEHALGYPVTEMAGRSFWELIHPYDVEISISSASRLLKGMDVLNHVIRFRHRDGSWRWLESSLTPYSDSLIYAASRDVTERKKTEEALRQSEKRLSEIIDFLPDATFAIDNEGRIITWNRALEEMTGFSSGDMLGKGDHEYSIPFYGIRRPILIDLVFEANDEVESGYNYIKRDGDSIMAEASLNLRGRNTTLWAKIAKLTDSGGKALGAIETLRDITEHKQMLEEQSKLREQLFQSQKMESMGLLAGGIAHDFNNMLTPIIGYSELMMLNLPAVDPNRQRVEQIQRSAELMRHLTSRLLAFSRKQVLDLKVISILEVIRGFEQMIHRTIRENIEIEIIADPEVGMVSADWGQMEQVLLNLSINAQDAMPEGGTLSIEARNMEIGGPYTAAHPDINPGPYVMLSVSDTGCGMDDETKLHIFEPFYTTKEKGKGTGLGLATLYGIVKQHGGGISVYSERDGGSVFRIFLPRVDGEGDMAPEPGHERGQILRGDETILVVEDNDTVRLFACEMLEDLGYRVLSAGAVDAGIKLCGSYSGTIHLLLSDVIMPKMNGRELYEQLKHERPGMKVLFMSGYTGSIIGHQGILEHGVNLLQKPFTIESLSRKVRSILEG